MAREQHTNRGRATGSTHDGSDHNYRMVIEDRYKRVVTMKKRIRLAAFAEFIYLLIHVLWHSIATIVFKEPLDTTHTAIGVAGVVLAVLYALALGLPRQERMWAAALFMFGSAFLTAELVLVFYQYHIYFGEHSRDKQAAATYPIYPRIAAKALESAHPSLSGEWIFEALKVFENALGVIGIVVCGAATMTTRELVMYKKEEQKQKEEEGDIKKDE